MKNYDLPLPPRKLCKNNSLGFFALALVLFCVHANSAATQPADAAEAVAKPGPRPNLIFIMADDLGKNLLSLYDAEVAIDTPNIDRLAAEGVVFDNAYASPLCLVTRAELITGRYPFNNGWVGHSDEPWFGSDGIFFDPKYMHSFAVPLREAGYATAMAGKWHGNSGLLPRILRAFGFDKWMRIDKLQATYAETHEGIVPISEFPPDFVNRFALDFIRENRDRPFFLYYPMHLVHDPYVPTPLRPDAETNIDKLIAMTEYADYLIGRLLQTLGELGLRDNTIVFFSGDNGTAVEELGQGQQILRTGKGKLTESGVNVPFIVSGGPVARRGRTDALTDFTDVLPTLAEFAGASVPPGYQIDGSSIAPFLSGQAEDTPRRWIASAASVRPVFDDYHGRYSYKNIPLIMGEDRMSWRPSTVGLVLRDKRFKLWEFRDAPAGLFELLYEGLLDRAGRETRRFHLSTRFYLDNISDGRMRPYALFDLHNDPLEKVNLWDSDDPEVVEAKRTLLEIRNTLPQNPAPVRYDPRAYNRELFAHWRFDRLGSGVHGQHIFSDAVGGYNAEAATTTVGLAPGQFGGALHAASNGTGASSGPSSFDSLMIAFEPRHPLASQVVTMTASAPRSRGPVSAWQWQGINKWGQWERRSSTTAQKEVWAPSKTDGGTKTFRAVATYRSGASEVSPPVAIEWRPSGSPVPVRVRGFNNFFKHNRSLAQYQIDENFSSFTLSAWVKLTKELAHDWPILRQPKYIGVRPLNAVLTKEGTLVIPLPAGQVATHRLKGTNEGDDAEPRLTFELSKDGKLNVQLPENRMTGNIVGIGAASPLHYTITPLKELIIELPEDCLTGSLKDDDNAPLLGLSITREGKLSLQLHADGRDGKLSSPPLDEEISKGWMHIAATWDAGHGGDAVLYVNGKTRAWSYLGKSLASAPAADLIIGLMSPPAAGSEDGPYLDDVAVWRQELTPGQIAALHSLGNRFGYNAAEVDMLFNAPRDYAVQVGGREWERMILPVDGNELTVVEAPEGVVEVHFGNGVSVQSRRPNDGGLVADVEPDLEQRP